MTPSKADGRLVDAAPPIVVAEQFIQATRDSGYRSAAFAIAELIDNAIDAEAAMIDIRVWEEGVGKRRDVAVAVLDDGTGMSKDVLWECLRFGGSERFGERESLGRYGMGLPNSSVSQAPRVDVYSWTGCDPEPLHTYLDVEEISRGGTGISEPSPAGLPDWLSEITDSGTLVQWTRCDRLRVKKASTLVRRLHPSIGRIFRVALRRGLTIRLNGEPIAPQDPLLRDGCAQLDGHSEPYGDAIEYRVRAPGGGASLMTVQFVELPIAAWHDLPIETKRAAGIVGGAGMTVLRGGREIDYGWHLFGKKRKENYDDWWRCELRFEPALDELVGITHNKQGINPTPELRGILEQDLERIARELNGRVRKAFAALRPPQTAPAVSRAKARDRYLPALRAAGRGPDRSLTRGYGYSIRIDREPRPEFFRAELQGSEVVLAINGNHPFYEHFYQEPDAHKDDLDLLLIAAGRALLDVSQGVREQVLQSWSDNLLAYLSR